MGRIGPTELIIILAILLLILGPRRLPDLARSVGQGLKEFRKGIKDMNNSVTFEVEPEKETEKGEKAPANG